MPSVDNIRRWLAFSEPYCMVRNTVDVSVSASPTVFTNVTWDKDVYDPWNMHDTAADTDKIVIPVAGVYLAIAGIPWDNNSTDEREIRLADVGSHHFAGVRAGAHGNDYQIVTGYNSFQALDSCRVLARQNTAGALNIVSINRLTFFGVFFLGGVGDLAGSI